ncbi:MAG: hypothetical protein H6719_29720 [Sandaracinaceae bacterium]|nr:hypothetical protein [Sandaracinaceae bacterium]
MAYGLVRDEATLRELLSFVLIYAPNFPKEDFLAPEDQITLDSAFRRLRDGLVFVRGLRSDAERYRSVCQNLERAHRCFAVGDRRGGTDLIQAVDAELFGGAQ